MDVASTLPTRAAPRRARRRARRGVTLVEIVVVIAILVALIALIAPALSNLMALEQRRVARDLSLTYELLQSEAVLRNVTFRIAYHLDGNYYEVEVGDPHTLVFADPESRKEAEEERERKLRRFTKREIEAGEADVEEETKFEVVAAKFKTRIDLPHGTRFGRIYTPQHGEWVEPSGEVEEDPEAPLIVYSYIFPNGASELTVVQLVESGDPDQGYSVVVEPLSGVVHLEGELVDYKDLYEFVPREGPELAL